MKDLKHTIIGLMATIFAILMFYTTTTAIASDVPESGFVTVPVKEMNRKDEYQYAGDKERIYKWGECTLNNEYSVRIKSGVSYMVYNLFIKSPCGKNWSYNVMVVPSTFDVEADMKMYSDGNLINNRVGYYDYDNYKILWFYNYYCSDGSNWSDNVDLFYTLPSDLMIIGGNSIDFKLIADKLNDFVNGVQVGEIKTSDDVEFDNDGNIVEKSKIVYDLEVPLNFRIKQKSLVDLPLIGGVGKDNTFYLTWEQSDKVDVQGWQTEIYYKEKGSAKKEWYSSKKYPYELSWSYWDSVANYKSKYTFNVENVPMQQELIDLLGFKPYSCNVTKLDFMIRNKYLDENGILHYSNYVYINNTSGSGSSGSDMDYSASEIDGEEVDKLLNENGSFSSDDLDNNIVSDSDNYFNSNVGDGVGSDDYLSAVGILKGLANDLKEFPSFFSSFFSFLPSHFIYALSALILFLITIAFIKSVL